MNQRWDDLRDHELASRLRAALGESPPELSERLEHLASSRLTPYEQRSRVPLWVELGPHLAGLALLIALLAGLMPWFARAVARPSPLEIVIMPSAGYALMIPVALFLGFEAMSGARTVRRWLR